MAQKSKVSGIVQIDGTPVERSVRAFGYNETAHDIDGTAVTLSKSLGNATSDPADGSYTIDLLAEYGGEIFVVAFDDYGDAFTAEQALAVGERIHPTTPNGHVWETTGAGDLPAEEPTWVVDTETSQLYGTASMIARPFYRPMVQGPIAPEVSTTVVLWTPENTSVDFWLDASDESTITLIGAAVESWADKSGNAHDANAPSASARPTLVEDSLNGLTIISGDGAVQTMEIAGPVVGGTVDRTVIIVARTDESSPSGDNSTIFAMGTDGASGSTFQMTAEIGIRVRGGNRIFDQQMSSTDFDIVVFDGLTGNTSGYEARKNGAQLGVNSTGGQSVSPTGDSSLFGKGSSLAKCSIAEIVSLPEGATLDLKKITEGYLAHKWGLEVKLPNDHPYKTDPPVVELAAPLGSRYWRFYITANAGDNDRTSAAEIVFKDSAGEAIAVVTSAASASNSSSNNSEKAFDSDHNSYWLTSYGGAAPSWISVDFGSNVAVNSFDIVSETTHPHLRTMAQFEIQTSDDNQTWATVQGYTELEWSSSQETKSFIVNMP